MKDVILVVDSKKILSFGLTQSLQTSNAQYVRFWTLWPFGTKRRFQ